MPLALPKSGIIGAALRIAALAAALVVGAAGAPAHAADEQSLSAGRDVIERQLDAFARDDGGAAYGLASPAIQEMFSSEATFMEMVRRGYQPVYRAKTHSFADARDTESGFEQLVRILDDHGQDWDALYSLEKASDGTWRISGCRLIKSVERSV